MEDQRISSPRPLFKDEEVDKGAKRFQMGGTSAGIVLDISKRGITINGYYEGLKGSEVRYACVREPVEITWKEFEKVKQSVFKGPTSKKDLLTPDRVDSPTKEYLKTLPVVTINSSKYYIDADRGERRSVRNPEQVFKFRQ